MRFIVTMALKRVSRIKEDLLKKTESLFLAQNKVAVLS